MTPSGLRVADSDMHIFEPPDLWQRYIDPAWRHAAPVGLTEMRRDMRVKVKSHVILRMGGGAAAARAQRVEGGATRAVLPRRAARLGPGLAARGDGRRGSRRRRPLPDARPLRARARHARRWSARTASSPPFAAAIARAYNDWLHDFCAAHPDRCFGAGDGGAARRRRGGRRGASLRRGARLQGDLPVAGRASTAGRGTTPPTIRCGRSASASASRSAFTAAARTTCGPTSRSRCFDKLMMWHTFSQPLGIMAAAVSLTAGGVLRALPGAPRRLSSRATARGRRGSSTASTSTTSGSGGSRRPTCG